MAKTNKKRTSRGKKRIGKRKQHKPVMLVIMDGMGLRKSKKGNAFTNASTPNFNRLKKEYPYAVLKASGKAVGLPEGYMGNSEVGHTHIGAGRLIPQELLILNKAIKDKSYFKNPELLGAIKHVKKKDAELHLMGLLSDAGVHSHINHLFALLELAKKHKLKGKVYVHCFLDGRDTPPKSAGKYIKMLEKKMKALGIGKIATIMGRYYAMDRDNRWNREHKAYDAMVNGKGRIADSAMEGLKKAYKKGETDEFVKPTIIMPSETALMKIYVNEGDSIIFFNFRSDRARQITRAFVEGKFNKFQRKRIIDLDFVCLTHYDKNIDAKVAFPPKKPKDTFGKIMEKNRKQQLRIAETEKYAHVTFFFNGGRETPFKYEDRIMVHSPKVATYDMQPEMSAPKVLKKVLSEIKKEKHDAIILNFANGDMVGHTGDYQATVKACETVDDAVGKIADIVLKKEGCCLITADHGNAEEMTGKHQTSHTTNPVPFILVSNDPGIKIRKKGSLQNIAPTMLDLMGIKRPGCMVESLIRKS